MEFISISCWNANFYQDLLYRESSEAANWHLNTWARTIMVVDLAQIVGVSFWILAAFKGSCFGLPCLFIVSSIQISLKWKTIQKSELVISIIAPYFCLKGAGKAGIITYTRSAGHELEFAQHGVKFICLCPGAVQTSIQVCNYIEHFLHLQTH